MINIIIKEIKTCLKNKCYVAGLNLALILPDICGKAEFPNDKPSVRYIKWLKYVKEHIDVCSEFFHFDIDENIIYDLRNSLLHEGNPKVNEKKTKDFVFFIRTYNTQTGSYTVYEKCIYNGEVNIYTYVDLISLCEILCFYAANYYKNNKSKFTFKSKMSTFNPRVNRIFALKNIDYDKEMEFIYKDFLKI